MQTLTLELFFQLKVRISNLLRKVELSKFLRLNQQTLGHFEQLTRLMVMWEDHKTLMILVRILMRDLRKG